MSNLNLLINLHHSILKRIISHIGRTSHTYLLSGCSCQPYAIPFAYCSEKNEIAHKATSLKGSTLTWAFPKSFYRPVEYGIQTFRARCHSLWKRDSTSSQSPNDDVCSLRPTESRLVSFSECLGPEASLVAEQITRCKIRSTTAALSGQLYVNSLGTICGCRTGIMVDVNSRMRISLLTAFGYICCSPSPLLP